MYYIVESNKSVSEAASALEQNVKAHKFGVLHVHNLGKTLNEKGVPFKEECQVFEVCNPIKAAEVLAVDMSLNMALPCRISVYSENGITKIGFIKPTAILSGLSDDEQLKHIATEVENTITQIVNESL